MHDMYYEAALRKQADLAIARKSSLWPSAVDFLRAYTAPDVVWLRDAIAVDPENWVAPYHFFWGMGVRNALRANGFSEGEFGVENLDNIYVALIEEAVR